MTGGVGEGRPWEGADMPGIHRTWAQSTGDHYYIRQRDYYHLLSPRGTYRYFNFVCDGKSRLEYCFERALRSPSPFPDPPRAGSKVGRAAVVIFRPGYVQSCQLRIEADGASGWFVSIPANVSPIQMKYPACNKQYICS